MKGIQRFIMKYYVLIPTEFVNYFLPVWILPILLYFITMSKHLIANAAKVRYLVVSCSILSLLLFLYKYLSRYLPTLALRPDKDIKRLFITCYWFWYMPLYNNLFYIGTYLHCFFNFYIKVVLWNIYFNFIIQLFF